MSKATAKNTGGVLSKAKLPAFLSDEAKRSTVYVPTRSNGRVELAVYSDGVPMLEEYTQSRLSPKSFFFPQTETLYRFDFDAVEEQGEEGVSGPRGQVVLFGVRPCDATSFALLDQVFGPENHGYGDPYYQARRDAALVVSFACHAPCASCFCTSVGGDPAGTRGSDVLVFDLSDRLLLRQVSEKGAEFLKRNADRLETPKPGDLRAAEELGAGARESMKPVSYDRAAVKKNLDERFENPIWEKITNSCIGCGACTYLCPTCHCFDIADEERHYKGRRIRTWDSCQYALFTRHASGHNPRPTKTQRLRQRFMHKFSYTVETVNEVYCVGCGRCVQYCPVNLDIREVLQEFSTT